MSVITCIGKHDKNVHNAIKNLSQIFNVVKKPNDTPQSDKFLLYYVHDLVI